MTESNGDNGRRLHGAFTSCGGLNDLVTNEKVASAGNPRAVLAFRCPNMEIPKMNAIIYLVGLVVVVMFILSFIGLR
jgi:hypothetical protein